jgi:hypothetical protein
MAIVELASMKAELGIIDSVDDALISSKINEAQAHLEALLGYTITEEFPSSVVVPGDLVAAVKMLAAGWYENREASLVGVSGMETPHGVWEIVRNRRRYSFGG